jgi:hypothetical protein
MLTNPKCVLLLSVLPILVGCGSRSRRELWIIPAGYVGWLRLDYAVAGASALPIEDGCYVVRLPRSGRLATSTANSPPIKRNEYTFEDSSGRHNLIVSTKTIQEYAVQLAFDFGKGKLNAAFPPPQAECVFVGTHVDFKSNGRNCEAWEPGQPEPPKFSEHHSPAYRSAQTPR